MNTCGNCRYWKYDKTSAIDRDHAAVGRKFCGLASDHIQRATSFAADSEACRKHSILPEAERKMVVGKRINEMYRVLGK